MDFGYIMSDCREPLCSQTVGNAILFGLQSMRGDVLEVRTLLSAITVGITKMNCSITPLDFAQGLLYGFKNMNR